MRLVFCFEILNKKTTKIEILNEQKKIYKNLRKNDLNLLIYFIVFLFFNNSISSG